MVEAQLAALSVETRREIHRLLVERARSVGELAAALPVSRPAVSQHLKVLVDAGLATSEKIGTRHVYSANLDGIAHLRDWIDGMWEMALDGFARFAGEQMEDGMEDVTTGIAPVRKEILVPGAPDSVFRLFTERMGEWWPMASHSVSGEETAAVVFETRVGGRVYEVAASGEEHDWGELTVWEPGRRIEMSWHPGLTSEQATHLAIGFEAAGEATRLTLIHDGWEARGVNGPQTRDNYDTGWDHVLGQIPGMSQA